MAEIQVSLFWASPLIYGLHTLPECVCLASVSDGRFLKALLVVQDCVCIHVLVRLLR